MFCAHELRKLSNMTEKCFEIIIFPRVKLENCSALAKKPFTRDFADLLNCPTAKSANPWREKP